MVYDVSRNDYNKNPKNSTVYTPSYLADFIFDISQGSHHIAFNDHQVVYDPCCGEGDLVWPWRDDPNTGKRSKHKIYGTDLDGMYGDFYDGFKELNYLDATKDDMDELMEGERPDLVLINPPFNTDHRNKDWLKTRKLGKALMPEIFLDKTMELFGTDQPMILITPMGFRLNQRVKSKRWKKYSNHEASISAIASIPLDIFPGVEFHVEVLFWNIGGLLPHYWFEESYLKKFEDNCKKRRKCGEEKTNSLR